MVEDNVVVKSVVAADALVEGVVTVRFVVNNVLLVELL